MRLWYDNRDPLLPSYPAVLLLKARCSISCTVMMQGPGLRYTGGDELRRAAAALSAPSFKVLDVEVGIALWTESQVAPLNVQHCANSQPVKLLLNADAPKQEVHSAILQLPAL